MRIAICDQNIQDAKKLKTALYSYSNLQKMDVLVDCYHTGKELISNPVKYHLFFIDYTLSGMSGLQTARAIRKRYPAGTIIFLSAETGGFILDTFEVNPFRFLLKPIDRDLLFSTLDEYFQMPNSKRPLWVKSGDDTFCMNVGDILYLEADNKYCLIGLKDKKILCHKTMATVYNRLPKNHFCKINRAYIVNFSYIQAYNKSLVRLQNGEGLPITRTYYKNFELEYRAFADPLEL